MTFDDGNDYIDDVMARPSQALLACYY